MSDSEEEKLEDYIIVEEEIGSFMTIIYREWLIPNESSFWHPGLPSDYRHMDAVRNHIIKNLKTETETDKRGKLVYNWTKIKYRSIIESSSKYGIIYILWFGMCMLNIWTKFYSSKKNFLHFFSSLVSCLYS